jgi:hypothetical protein
MSTPQINVPYRGGCACGAVRYECAAAPVAMFNCHCRDCQRFSGGAFGAIALMRESSVRLTTGQAKYHRVIGDSGRWVDRGFCEVCGTPLFAKVERAPGYLTVKPGTLDDASWFRPTIDTWAPSAPAWLPLDPALPKAEKTPNVIKRAEAGGD